MGKSMSGKKKEDNQQVPVTAAAGENALRLAAGVNQIPYIPYTGMDTAAPPDQLVDAWNQSNNWSAAFNTPGQAAPAISQPNYEVDPVTGIKGTRSITGLEAELAKLDQMYPGMAAYLKSMFMNPETGQLSSFWDTKVRGTKAMKDRDKSGYTIRAGGLPTTRSI